MDQPALLDFSCWCPNPARPNAAPLEWGIEMDNPVGLSRHGWKPGQLESGRPDRGRRPSIARRIARRPGGVGHQG